MFFYTKNFIELHVFYIYKIKSFTLDVFFVWKIFDIWDDFKLENDMLISYMLSFLNVNLTKIKLLYKPTVILTLLWLGIFPRKFGMICCRPYHSMDNTNSSRLQLILQTTDLVLSVIRSNVSNYFPTNIYLWPLLDKLYYSNKEMAFLGFQFCGTKGLFCEILKIF